jgi:hypothetical protein
MTKAQTASLIRILNSEAADLRKKQNELIEADPGMIKSETQNQHAFINGQVDALRQAVRQINMSSAIR